MLKFGSACVSDILFGKYQAKQKVVKLGNSNIFHFKVVLRLGEDFGSTDLTCPDLRLKLLYIFTSIGL